MGWRKIFNNHTQADSAGTSGQSPTENEMRDYLAALTEELNFRLVCGQLQAPENGECLPTAQSRVLWIESISLTSYETQEAEPGVRRENWLNNLTGRILSFFRRTRKEGESLWQ